MKSEDLNIKLYRADTPAELNADDKALFEKAIQALDTAYAPYSQFRVGCAVRLANGEVILGSNQENMAYPSGLCAERVAIFSASARFPGVPIHSLAVVARPLSEDQVLVVSPCGACRQVMVEYERIQDEPMKIITGAISGPVYISENAHALLPFAFFDSGLRK